MSKKLNSEAIFWRFSSKAKLKHMLLLVRLYELGSMKRTADAMNVSQPAVSLMVNELESLLEVELFYRHARGVVATQVTRELVPVARRIIEAMRDGSEIISSSVNDREGFVRIAATPAALCGLIQPKISHLSSHFPHTMIDIAEVTAADALRPITENSCDLLCLRRPNVIPEGWEFHEVEEDELITVCSANHPLAAAHEISIDQIRKMKWLISRGGSLAKTRFDIMIEKYQLDERNFCSVLTHTPLLTMELLKHSEMLGYIPKSVAKPWLMASDIVQLMQPPAEKIDPLGILIQSDIASNATTSVFSLLVDRSVGTH